jgi:RIO kinase 1
MRGTDRLDLLVEQGIIQEVIRPLMSGKEASLFVVATEDGYYAAKIYKDAENRSFRQRTVYQEGRRSRNSRSQRAMEKHSRFGRETAEEAWKQAEVDALYRLAEAGVRVPRPHLFVDGVLLMDLILDEDGDPAPRLFDVDLQEDEAVEMYGWLVRQAVWMLCAGLVHGDLSECNVLLAWDGPVIIDFPQATDAARNQSARALFLRDIENLTRYFARFAPQIAPNQVGQEIWSLYERSQLFPDSPLTGRFRGPRGRANAQGVLREVAAAAREAARRGEPGRLVEMQRVEREAQRTARTAPPPPAPEDLGDLDTYLSES